MSDYLLSNLNKRTAKLGNTQYTRDELNEIHFNLIYQECFSHGRRGHNQILLEAKLARAAGFGLNKSLSLTFSNVLVQPLEKRGIFKGKGI